jgi:hypothetical protein
MKEAKNTIRKNRIKETEAYQETPKVVTQIRK